MVRYMNKAADNITMKQRIEEKYNSFSEKEKLVAKYVIDHYSESMLLSSTELAQMAKVSHTAVIRFAKDMGYSGYMEYKKELRTEYAPAHRVYGSLSNMDKGQEGDYLHKYFRSLINDVNDFTDKIDIDILTKMADQIMKTKRLYLVGFGSDELVVHFLKNYVNLMGVQCIPVTEEGLALKEKLFLMDSEDTVFLSVYPTLMQSEIWVGKYAKEKNATIMLITDSEVTARLVNADIYAVFNESTENFFNSYVLQMAFCNALLLHIYERYTERTAKSLELYEEDLLK